CRDGAWKNPPPWLTQGSSHVIENRNDPNASSEGNDPANHEREYVDRRPDFVADVVNDPDGEEVSEDDQSAGDAERDERKGHKDKRARAAAPEGPALRRKVVRTPQAFHERRNHRRRSQGRNENGADEHVSGFGVPRRRKVALDQWNHIRRQKAVKDRG